MINFFNKISYKKDRTIRVIVTFNNGSITCGSGFFINKRDFFTCFHVVFGGGLKDVRVDAQFTQLIDPDEHTKLENFLRNKLARIELCFPNGTRKEAKLIKFDEKYDIVLLTLLDPNFKVKFFRANLKGKFNYGDEVFLCGYPFAVGYVNTNFPFAVSTGTVSSFPEATIGGEKYEHIQINSINLGGNSGGPLFRKNSNKVIGIINGNMNWGRNDLGIFGNPLLSGTLQVPLSIAYSTYLKLLKDKTEIFK